MLAKQKVSLSSSLVDTSRWSQFFRKYEVGSLPEVAQSKATTGTKVFSLFPRLCAEGVKLKKDSLALHSQEGEEKEVSR